MQSFSGSLKLSKNTCFIWIFDVRRILLKINEFFFCLFFVCANDLKLIVM